MLPVCARMVFQSRYLTSQEKPVNHLFKFVTLWDRPFGAIFANSMAYIERKLVLSTHLGKKEC